MSRMASKIKILILLIHPKCYGDFFLDLTLFLTKIAEIFMKIFHEDLNIKMERKIIQFLNIH